MDNRNVEVKEATRDQFKVYFRVTEDGVEKPSLVFINRNIGRLSGASRGLVQAESSQARSWHHVAR